MHKDDDKEKWACPRCRDKYVQSATEIASLFLLAMIVGAFLQWMVL